MFFIFFPHVYSGSLLFSTPETNFNMAHHAQTCFGNALTLHDLVYVPLFFLFLKPILMLRYT
jgi:hypothetical protein